MTYYLIDAAVLLNDEQFSFLPGKRYVTTSLVAMEIKDFRSRALLDNALKNNFLRIIDPSAEALQKITDLAANIGFRLSKADFSLLALALDFKSKKKRVKVVTDDFSVQNLLLALRISFDSVIQGRIKEFRVFRKKKLGF